MVSSVPVNTTVLPANGVSAEAASSGSTITPLDEIVDDPGIARFAEERRQIVGDADADLVDVAQLGVALPDLLGFLRNRGARRAFRGRRLHGPAPAPESP